MVDRDQSPSQQSEWSGVLAVLVGAGPAGDFTRPLAGHPLAAYSAAAALQSKLVGRVVVAGDPSLVEILAPYTTQRDCPEETVTQAPLPPSIQSFDQAVAYFAGEGRQHLLDLAGPAGEIAVFLDLYWPLHPQQVLDKAIDTLKRHPKTGRIASLAPCEPANRWWAARGSDNPEPIVKLDDRQVYTQTGHFEIIRLAEGAQTESAAPFLLDVRYSVKACEPAKRDWAEWLVQYSNLDLVYPGHQPRPLPEKVVLFVMDFDGVLTDNRVWVDEQGHETIAANRSDSLGITYLRRAGIEPLVISMETNPVVTARCTKMKVPVLQGINDKAPILVGYMEEKGIDPQQVVYLGNDVNDLPCFPVVGCAVAVADSEPVVRRQADLVLARAGGHAAVRELCDLLIERKKKLTTDKNR